MRQSSLGLHVADTTTFCPRGRQHCVPHHCPQKRTWYNTVAFISASRLKFVMRTPPTAGPPRQRSPVQHAGSHSPSSPTPIPNFSGRVHYGEMAGFASIPLDRATLATAIQVRQHPNLTLSRGEVDPNSPQNPRPQPCHPPVPVGAHICAALAMADGSGRVASHQRFPAHDGGIQQRQHGMGH